MGAKRNADTMILFGGGLEADLKNKISSFLSLTGKDRGQYY